MNVPSSSSEHKRHPKNLSVTAFYYIDCDGDVDLLLPHLEEPPSFLDGVLTYVTPASGLNYRRSIAQYPWTDANNCDDRAPCEESQEYEEKFPDIQLEPIEEARMPNELRESRQSPEPTEQVTPEQPCSMDQGHTIDEHDAAPNRDENYVRIRTLSKHLTFSSPHFKRNL